MDATELCTCGADLEPVLPKRNKTTKRYYKECSGCGKRVPVAVSLLTPEEKAIADAAPPPAPPPAEPPQAAQEPPTASPPTPEAAATPAPDAAPAASSPEDDGTSYAPQANPPPQKDASVGVGIAVALGVAALGALAVHLAKKGGYPKNGPPGSERA